MTNSNKNNLIIRYFIFTFLHLTYKNVKDWIPSTQYKNTKEEKFK